MDGSICCFFIQIKVNTSCKVTFVLGIRSDFDPYSLANSSANIKHWPRPDGRLVSWWRSTIMRYLIEQIMAHGSRINQMDQRQLTTTMITIIC